MTATPWTAAWVVYRGEAPLDPLQRKRLIAPALREKGIAR